MNFLVTFMLCLTAVNAAFFSNHSSLSGDFRHLVNGSKSSQISFHGNIQHASNNSRVNQTFLEKNNANASSLYDSKDFVDCTKYSAAELANATTPMPFEEYWCSQIYQAPSDQAAIAEDLFGSYVRNQGQLYGLDPPTKSFCLSLEKENYTSFFANSRHGKTWDPVYTSPCCDTSSCAVEVANAQMLYWPTPAPVPSATTIIGSDGFTYTSPSVYVVYTNISATDGCASTIGNTYGITTLSYAPSDLHTIGADYAFEGTTSFSIGKESWNTINYADLFPNCTSLAFNLSNLTEARRIILNNLKHCAPMLQDSPALGLIDPAWARCNQKIAIIDPPRALIPGKALGPAPPDPTPNSGPQAAPTIASPASPAAKPTPAPTPAPGLPVSSPKSDPQWGTPNDPGSAKDPAANDSNANNHHADADPTPAISPTSTRESSNKDSHTDKNPPVVAAKPAQDPASIKDSASSDSSTDNDPADIVQKPSGNPASAKEPFNGDPPANKDPVVVAQKFENDQSGSQDTYSQPAAPIPVPEASVTTIAGHSIQVPVSQPSASVVLVDGQPITAGHDPTAISSTRIALHTNGDLVLGTSTIYNLLPTVPAQAPFVTTAAGHKILIPPSQSSVVMVDGQPITAGALPMTLSSTHVALHTNGDLVLGTSTIHNLLPTNPPVPAQAPFVTAAAGHSILIAPSQPSVVIVDGRPITAGASPMTVSNTPVALHPNGDLILGPSTIPNILPTPPPASQSYFPIGSQTITLSSSHILAAGTTHAPGDPAFVIDNTIISLGSSALHIGTSNIPIPTLDPPPPAITTTTAAGHLLTLLPSGIGIVVSGTTLTPNAPAITISSTPLSYGPNGFVAGPSTVPMPLILPPTPTPPSTAPGETSTALLPNGIAVVLSGTTLTPNAQPALTVSAEVISLGANDGLVVNGTAATMSLPPRVSATTDGMLGDDDDGGGGGPSNATQNSSTLHNSSGDIKIFSGDADSVALGRSMCVLIGAVMALWLYYYV